MKSTEKTNATETVVAIMSRWERPAEPSWERAKELVGNVRQSMRDIVALGLELDALRRQWFAERSGAGRPSEKNCVKGVNAISQITIQQVVGWQNRVRQELDISHVTALRLIERAQTVVLLNQVRECAEVTYYTNQKEKRVIAPTDDMRRMAGEALEQVVAGTVAAPRAWAGVIGEGKRRGKSVHRAAVDHAGNLKKALASLRTSLPHWRHLDPEERAEIETLWSQVTKHLPDTWM